MKTAIILGCSQMDTLKGLIMRQLAMIHLNYDLYIGYDVKYGVPRPIPPQFKLVGLDYVILKRRYGNKINNFNGKWTDNPSKLGCIDWASRTNYEYVWYIEDDVFCKQWLSFFNTYSHIQSDILCRSFKGMFPGWTKNNWRIGNKKHCCSPPGISITSLMVVRFSKKCINNIIREIVAEPTTSHHELFIPYVVNKNKLSITSLTHFHSRSVHLNGGKLPNFTKHIIDKSLDIIFHPVKYNIYYKVNSNKPKVITSRNIQVPTSEWVPISHTTRISVVHKSITKLTKRNNKMPRLINK